MEKVQDKISFHFKPNHVTSFKNFNNNNNRQRSPERPTVDEKQPLFPVSPTRTPLLEPRRAVPVSPLLENQAPLPLPKQLHFKAPDTRKTLKKGAHRHKVADNNLTMGPPSVIKKQSNGTHDMDIDIERSRKMSAPPPLLKSVLPSSHMKPPHQVPVAQNLDSFVQSYRQLQNDCEQYKIQLESSKRSLIEERTKAEQFKNNLITNFTCFTELDLIRYQHTETRLRRWDEHSVLFQSVMTSMDRLVAQRKERSSAELEACKSKLRHLYQLWSGQTYDRTWIIKYKLVLSCLNEGIQQQRTDIQSFMSNTVQKQTETLHHIHKDVRMVSHDLVNMVTSSSIEAVAIKSIKSESRLVSEKLNNVLSSLHDMDEMVLVESVNESSLKMRCEQLERQNEELKQNIQSNHKSYLTDMKLLEDENQNILAQLKEAQTPKRRRLRKLPAV
ncbi:hypothetical protein K501DRAFT_328098 [Backusella circina FSU 941]|nr:hypothetical protein K501DRAFT_328098 [Backusella circina FSU 941]